MKTSAGILLVRLREGRPEVLLAHPGGPLWAKRDAGAWTIPKGEVDPGEEPIDAARRELREETGLAVDGPMWPLGSVRQKGGKVVHAWACVADFDPASLSSGTFTMEWPPRSGRTREFPEVDRVAWFSLDDARAALLPAQAAFLDAVARLTTS